MGITRDHNRGDLTTGPIRIYPGDAVSEAQVLRRPRIGVDYAGEWAAAPYRLFVAESVGVSRPRR